jgi:hypothetical protein
MCTFVVQGSIFYRIAEKRKTKETAVKQGLADLQGQIGLQNGATKVNGTRQRKKVDR